MAFYVYILSNGIDDELYKGFSERPFERLHQHNQGNAQFTATKKDWTIAGLFNFTTKKEALVFEKKIKKWNRRSLDKLLQHPQNIIKDYPAD